MKTLMEQAQEALNAVRGADNIVFDSETSGLDWKRNSVVGYVLTTAPNENWYIPIRHGGGGNLADPNVGPLLKPDDKTAVHWFEKELAKAFNERKGKIIGHNLKFDAHFSANHGVMLGRNIECTQINEALLDEHARSFSLDSSARRHGVTAKLGEELYAHLASQFNCKADRSSMGDFWRLSGTDAIGVDYAIGDGISTFELWQSQSKRIVEEELQFIHDIESRLIWTIFRVERRGIKVDVNRLKQVIGIVDGQLADTMRALPENFNTRSGPQVKAFIVSAAGRTDWPTTDKGNPSFTEKWLKSFPEGQLIIKARQLSNLKNSFITPLVENHIFEGRVYSSLNQMKSDDYGTISGRFSSSQPNLQQVPKRDKVLGKLFRSAFVPDEGMEFYEADYSQCEPRLFAHYANEQSLIDGYNSSPPRDMHAVVAEMFDVERDPTAKRMNMGILTGMQADTFSEHMGWDKAFAKEMFNKWFDSFPGIKEFQYKAKNRMINRGYIRTILNRRCRLDYPRFAYKAVSRIIQGGNADILKYKMLKVDEMLEREGDKTHLLMTVHDSFEWQAPDNAEGEDTSKRIVEFMSDVQTEPFNLRVPFIMDVGHGKNWAIATWGTD